MPTLISRNPATEKIEARFTTLSKAQLEKKLAAAQRAFKAWSQLAIEKRLSYIAALSKLLLTRKNQLAKLTTRDMGKPFTAAQSEIEKCALCCDTYIHDAAKHLAPKEVKTEAKKSTVRFEPLGVILGVMPWNFPFWQVFRFAIPTLAAGNVVLVKHASNVPRCAQAIEALFNDAGFPPAAYTNLFLTSRELAPLIADTRIAGVSLTGSVAAGRSLAALAGSSLKKVVLELGGSDPFIVLADADIKKAAAIAVRARMTNTGQSCVAAKRFIVVKSIAKKFESLFVQEMRSLALGAPLNPDIKVAPLARADLVETLDKQVKKAIQQGAKLLCGGSRPNRKGYYYLPTVLSGISLKMDIAHEEVFGPVACLYIVKDETEALKIANATRFGLGASIWSRNLKKAEALAAKLEAGFVAINGMVRSDPRLPFGGVKDSGLGRELGEFGIREFVNVKTVVVN